MDKEVLTVGELARLMGTTVRTLQYYDQEGLLKPSSLSEGGRRLYSAKDVVKLHQILSFKYLGFSLEEIKSRLFTLESPQQVAQALAHQMRAMKEQIAELQEALQAASALHDEVTAMQKVDFVKYAEIIELLKSGNQGYWVWKFFDRTLTDHIQQRFGDDAEAGLRIFTTYQELLEEAVTLKRSGEPPQSGSSRKLAEKWWHMILEFTGGNMELLPELEAFNQKNWNNELAAKQREINDYIEAALQWYLGAQEKE